MPVWADTERRSNANVLRSWIVGAHLVRDRGLPAAGSFAAEPAIHARRLDAGIPIALELALLWLMVADMTLGNWLGFYRLTWYDKALHLSSSVLLGAIGFLAIYVLHLTHNTRFHPWLDGLAILLVTLGLGAIWELGEYGVDQLFDRRTQGAPNMTAHEDTMFDLLLDAGGGVIGAVLGPIYIRRAKQIRDQVAALGRMIEGTADAERASSRP